MHFFLLCGRGPEEKRKKWVDHLLMVAEHITVAQWTGVVEVLNIITRGARGIIHPRALDVVDLGARGIEEILVINNGVDITWSRPNGIYLRSMVIAVRISNPRLQIAIQKWMGQCIG